MVTKENRSKKKWVEKGTKFVGEFQKLCKTEEIQVFSAMSETKAAFAERSKQSQKIIFYRYMELWIQIQYYYDSFHYHNYFLMKMFERLDTKECNEFRLFLHSVQQTTTRIWKTQV